MTQTKIERLRNEMIAEHGDVTLLKCINRETHAVMSTVTLSKASIKNTSDMKEVQKRSSESNAESHSSIAESRQSSPIGNGIPYKDIVEQARLYIHTLGSFEKFAEWGLVRPLAQV